MPPCASGSFARRRVRICSSSLTQRRFRANGGAHERIVGSRSHQKEAEPPKLSKVAHAAARDLIEPARKVLAIESRKAAVDNQKDVLREVVAIRLRSPQCTNPAAHLVEESVVDFLEFHRVGWRRCRP